MELDFQKQKQKIAALSDAELVARSRDPGASATVRMLVEAEIAHRGVDRNRVSTPGALPKLSRRGGNFFSFVVMAVIIISILAGLIEDMGVDLLELIRQWFTGDENGAG